MTEGVFPKADGEVLYGEDVNILHDYSYLVIKGLMYNWIETKTQAGSNMGIAQINKPMIVDTFLSDNAVTKTNLTYDSTSNSYGADNAAVVFESLLYYQLDDITNVRVLVDYEIFKIENVAWTNTGTATDGYISVTGSSSTGGTSTNTTHNFYGKTSTIRIAYSWSTVSSGSGSTSGYARLIKAGDPATYVSLYSWSQGPGTGNGSGGHRLTFQSDGTDMHVYRDGEFYTTLDVTTLGTDIDLIVSAAISSSGTYFTAVINASLLGESGLVGYKASSYTTTPVVEISSDAGANYTTVDTPTTAESPTTIGTVGKIVQAKVSCTVASDEGLEIKNIAIQKIG